MRVLVVAFDGARGRLGRATALDCEREEGEGGRARDGDDVRFRSDAAGMTGGGKLNEGEMGREAPTLGRAARA